MLFNFLKIYFDICAVVLLQTNLGRSSKIDDIDWEKAGGRLCATIDDYVLVSLLLKIFLSGSYRVFLEFVLLLLCFFFF